MSAELNTQQQGANTQPEGNGEQAPGKTFTQEQVNQIVSERLSREREKMKPDPIEERERALAARETAMSCKEYLNEKKYPTILLELFDTDNLELFTSKTEKLLEAFPDIIADKGKTPIFTRGTGVSGALNMDAIAQAFKPKI